VPNQSLRYYCAVRIEVSRRLCFVRNSVLVLHSSNIVSSLTSDSSFRERYYLRGVQKGVWESRKAHDALEAKRRSTMNTNSRRVRETGDVYQYKEIKSSRAETAAMTAFETE
jgi:hypothetical protein